MIFHQMRKFYSNCQNLKLLIWVIMEINLLDVKQESKDGTFSKLNRALVNSKWPTSYPDAIVSHLSIISLDHAPILLNVTPLLRLLLFMALDLKLNGYCKMIF